MIKDIVKNGFVILLTGITTTTIGHYAEFWAFAYIFSFIVAIFYSLFSSATEE